MFTNLWLHRSGPVWSQLEATNVGLEILTVAMRQNPIVLHSETHVLNLNNLTNWRREHSRSQASTSP